jgi:hypothetical protein
MITNPESFKNPPGGSSYPILSGSSFQVSLSDKILSSMIERNKSVNLSIKFIGLVED